MNGVERGLKRQAMRTNIRGIEATESGTSGAGEVQRAERLAPVLLPVEVRCHTLRMHMEQGTRSGQQHRTVMQQALQQNSSI